ncbi:MAG: ElyC/SanA/YdcF family protein [Acidobacteriota bacterium]
MLNGRDIVCISSIDWDFIWQGHQQIMATLAARGNRVLFIENTGVRAPRVRDAARLRARVRNWWRGTKGFREERPNLFVFSPLVLPLPYSRIACRLNRTIMVRACRRWMRATGFGRPIVWSFLPTPLARALIDSLDPEVTVYYCIDDLASSSRQARRITRSEVALFREADLVFVTSEKLRQRAAGHRPDVHLFPFGVDLTAFERVRDGAAPVPQELEGLPRPVIGYVGGLHQWVDQELLVATAAAFPHGSVVLVGPPQTDVSRLAACRNVHLLGARSHDELPHYVKAFDVGLVPYVLTEYTANVYPTKLNEYLVMGKPVVSTRLAEVERFNRETGTVVAIAPDTGSFLEAVRLALEPVAPEMKARRTEVARANAWDARVAAMSDLIESALVARDAGERAAWERTLLRLYRAGRRRLAASLGAVLVLLAIVFYTPAVWWAAAPLRVSAEPRPADAIVVFAGGVGESGRAGGGYQERVKHAADLYHRGYATHLVFSSGFSFVFREAEVMKQLAVSIGVPADAIVLESKAANTHENVTFVARILENRGWRSALLISSPYHMRRAVMVWRRVAPGTDVIAAPVPVSQFYLHGAMQGPTLEQIGGIVHEYGAMVIYWWRGWI